jgi:WD40 repeat protein
MKCNFPSQFQTFNDKMILSTSRDDKKILLWDENTASLVYTYEDQNMKSFISNEKLFVVGKDLYSEYIIALQENKSLMSIWKTNSSECAIKCTMTDERIVSVDICQNNKIIYISTETGNLLIYELFSGNLINSISVSSTSVICVKTLTRDGGIVSVLCEDYIKLFSCSELISNNNSALIEVPNYDKLNKLLFIKELNVLCLYSTLKNKIVIYSVSSLKIVKNIYLANNTASLISITNDYESLYATFDDGNVFLLDLKPILNNEENTCHFNCLDNIFPIIQTESRINSLCVTYKNIITGLEDGKVIIWNKLNYKKENNFNIHKGGVTNVIVINRPISQYGLNFNSTIEETNVKSLKKASLGYNHSVLVKNSIKTDDYIENLLNHNLNGEEKNLYTFNFNDTQHINGKKEKVTAQVSNNKANIKSSTNANLEDISFLKKKLGEVYGMINK